ncbi:acyl-CoA N-acyltransferase [Hypoxylon sp. FL1857]|nr:acyl-CoA N-acyltransferase [Hypoxylon sp. FL1857]
MPLKLHELTTDDEFKAMVAVEHEAYDKPFNGFWEMLKGFSQEEFCARQLSWHRHDPSSHWLYVTDEETGDVVGGIQWNLYETNPYAKEQPALTAYWFPEGPMRQVGDQLLLGLTTRRPRYMSKPHLLISYCFVHSAHRNRGVASLMLKWGTDKADELGLEAFVESTDIGRKAYEKAGFKVIDELNLDAHTDAPNEEFNASREKFGCPMHAWVMKRDVVST